MSDLEQLLKEVKEEANKQQEKVITTALHSTVFAPYVYVWCEALKRRLPAAWRWNHETQTVEFGTGEGTPLTHEEPYYGEY